MNWGFCVIARIWRWYGRRRFNDRGPLKGPQNVFVLDLAHELPLTIYTQRNKCLSQPLLTVIAVDRESDVLFSGNQSRPRRKWLVCSELGEPFSV